MHLDLPLIWAAIIATAVLLYVLLDGFDLGVGILFPSAEDAERDIMVASIAPVWDGNETWLVLGGGGMFVVIPVAYAILMPALYLPVMAMLAGLILRGVAFEFRLHGRVRGKRFWTWAFAVGSTAAALAQGFILGGFIQGVQVRLGQFAGGPLDWATPYSLLVALGLAAGYTLLGAAWLMIKAEDELHGRAREWAGRAAVAVAGILAVVSVATLFLHPLVSIRWGVGVHFAIDGRRFLPLMPIPLMGAFGLLMAFAGARSPQSHPHTPMVGAMLAFLSGYLGLAVGFLPYIVPYAVTYQEAASSAGALTLMLAGTAVLLPLNLAYSAWVYWVFRGKVATDAYH